MCLLLCQALWHITEQSNYSVQRASRRFSTIPACMYLSALFACTINTKMGACCEDCASLFPRRCCVLTMRAEVEVKLTEAGS